MTPTHGVCFAICFVLIAVVPATSYAVDCSVPSGAYPTVQEAIDDTNCTTVNLADQTYDESLLVDRSLSIVGPPALADINGHVHVQGVGTVVQMDNLMIENGCTPEAYLVNSSGHVDSSRLEIAWVSGAPCPPVFTPLFSDGFETGNTSLWSGVAP